MIYKIFKKVMSRMKRKCNAKDVKRFSSLKLPDGVNKRVYSYINDGDDLHKFNLYKEHNHAHIKYPILIDIHGGAWVYGQKDLNDHFCYHMCLKGFNVLCPSFRLIDDGTYLNDMIQDLFSFYHFLEEYKDIMEISLDNVFITGDSAGAQLVLLSAVINQREDLQKIFNVQPLSFDFKAIALTHPICDVDNAIYFKHMKWISKKITGPCLLRNLYGQDYKNNDVCKASLKPEAYLTKDLKLGDLFLLTSSKDFMFNHGTYDLIKALEQVDIPYTLYKEEAKDADHVFNVCYPDRESSQRCNNMIANFFKEKCKDS